MNQRPPNSSLGARLGLYPFAFFALVLLGCSPGGADERESTKVDEGAAAPGFTATTLDGDSFSLEEATREGKVVLINFFATWCGPCVAEMPHLEKEVQAQFGKRDDFVLLSIGREHTAEELAPFVKEHSLTFAVAPDPKREIYGLYAEKYIPRNFLIGKDGTVLLSSTGFSQAEFSTLLERIEGALKVD